MEVLVLFIKHYNIAVDFCVILTYRFCNILNINLDVIWLPSFREIFSVIIINIVN